MSENPNIIKHIPIGTAVEYGDFQYAGLREPMVVKGIICKCSQCHSHMSTINVAVDKDQVLVACPTCFAIHDDTVSNHIHGKELISSFLTGKPYKKDGVIYPSAFHDLEYVKQNATFAAWHTIQLDRHGISPFSAEVRRKNLDKYCDDSVGVENDTMNFGFPTPPPSESETLYRAYVPPPLERDKPANITQFIEVLANIMSRLEKLEVKTFKKDLNSSTQAMVDEVRKSLADEWCIASKGVLKTIRKLDEQVEYLSKPWYVRIFCRNPAHPLNDVYISTVDKDNRPTPSPPPPPK